MKRATNLPLQWFTFLLFTAVLLSTKTYALSPDTIPLLQVTGKVVDQSKHPIAGATVKLRGTNKGTLTDDLGRFRLDDVMINSKLIFSSIGFETKQITVAKHSMLTITLDSSIREMKSVNVVSTGYEFLQKDRSPGSFVQVDMDMLGRRPSTGFLSRLEGITNSLLFSRLPNGLPVLTIRGNSTINANKDLLIVVDNFPYEGDINNINPNDIESITILRDAVAASIWGARSGNGVIVITTKKGQYNKKLRINLFSNLTMQARTKLSQSRDHINSSDYIDLETFLFNKGYFDADIQNTLAQTPLSEAVEILNQEAQGLLTRQQAAAQIDLLRKNDVRKDFENYLFRPVLRQQYGVNFSGGSPIANYQISVGYDKNKESRIGDDFSRLTLRSVTSIKLTDRFELITDINYISGITALNLTHPNTVMGGDGKMIRPYTLIAAANGDPLSIIKDYRDGYTTSGQNARLSNWQYYPLYERDLSDNKTKQSELRIAMGLNSRITDYLSLEVQYQFQKANADTRINYPSESYYVSNMVNRFAVVSPDVPITYPLPRGSQLDLSSSLLVAHNLRAKLSFHKSWNANVITAIAGFDVRESDITNSRNYLYGVNNNTGSKSYVRYDSAYSVAPYGTDYITDHSAPISGNINRDRAWFGNAAYTYDNRYTLSISGRIDQANIYGVRANQKSTPLWSTGVMWNLKNEFFNETKWLHIFKLRAALGINANRLNNVTAYTTGTLYPTSSATQPPYANIQALGNPNITWEKVKILNFGLDFDVSHHVTGTVEFYNKNGIDLIGLVPLASSTGFLNVMGNYATIKGKGVDISLNVLNIGNKVKLNSSFNFSYTTDKVTKYDGDPNLQIGQPIRSLRSFRSAGLDSSGNPQGYLKGIPSKAYLELLRVPIQEKVYHGSLTPKIFGGIINTFSWKNFSAYVNVQYKMDYYFQNTSILYDPLLKRGVLHEDYAKRWQKPGDEKKTRVPSLEFPAISAGRDAFYKDSEDLVEKGDHIRVQDAGISYIFSKEIFKKLPFINAQLNFNVSNIGIIWKAASGRVDPDYQQVVPPSKAYSIGLKITL